MVRENVLARQVSVNVQAGFARAAYALRQQDIDGVVEALSAAVNLYEQHPAQVHEPLSHLRDLLAFIRAIRSLCATLGRPDDDFAALEFRAEALRRPLH